MKRFYDVELKISARHREDNKAFWTAEESTDRVLFDSSARKIWTYDRLYGDNYAVKNIYKLPRGDIYTIEIEFKP